MPVEKGGMAMTDERLFDIAFVAIMVAQFLLGLIAGMSLDG